MPVLFSRVDEQTKLMAKHLAEQDQRSISAQIAWLIRQEWARRYSQPNPLITVQSAIEAGKAISGGEK